jgi:hypothetical protein
MNWRAGRNPSKGGAKAAPSLAPSSHLRSAGLSMRWQSGCDQTQMISCRSAGVSQATWFSRSRARRSHDLRTGKLGRPVRKRQKMKFRLLVAGVSARPRNESLLDGWLPSSLGSTRRPHWDDL